MISRKDALSAKEGMERYKSQDMQLRVNLNTRCAILMSFANVPRQTRWGVGFGPRDCSDYSSGISVIPLSKLTEADNKWMLSAEYGGTGGKTLEAGMVVEEPDIEIGAGVSSKGMLPYNYAAAKNLRCIQLSLAEWQRTEAANMAHSQAVTDLRVNAIASLLRKTVQRANKTTTATTRRLRCPSHSHSLNFRQTSNFRPASHSICLGSHHHQDPIEVDIDELNLISTHAC